MSRLLSILAVAGALALAACESVIYVPAPAPPPIVQPPDAPPPPPPPTDLPPPVVPPDAPVSVAELVARLAVGSTEAEASEVFGRAPDNLAPAYGPAPEVRRWYVEAPDGKWAVHAVMRGGKVASAGSAKVETIP